MLSNLEIKASQLRDVLSNDDVRCTQNIPNIKSELELHVVLFRSDQRSDIDSGILEPIYCITRKWITSIIWIIGDSSLRSALEDTAISICSYRSDN